MHWQINVVLLVGLCLLVCTAPVLRPLDNILPCTHTPLPNGAVVLLSPLGELRAAVEKLVCGTPVTHAGLLWVDRGGVPFIFHTLRATGAHLEPFFPWIRRVTRRNQVFVRRLIGPRIPGGAQLESVLMPYLGMSYSFGFWKAVMQSWWPGMEMPRATNPPDRFCSELVAEVLELIGVLNFTPSALVPRLVLPGDFWSPNRLPFVQGFGLLPPEEVV
jgi:hypothetical protein